MLEIVQQTVCAPCPAVSADAQLARELIGLVWLLVGAIVGGGGVQMIARRRANGQHQAGPE